MDLAPARQAILLAPVQKAVPLARPGWPGAATARAPDRNAQVAQQFETLIAATLLRSARAARLGDDGLGATGDGVRDLIDRQRAEAIARAAPIGVARLLAPAALPAREGVPRLDRARR